MKNKFRNGDGKPVVALDIDGNLGDYHSHFLWFATHWFGRKMPQPSDINPGLPLWQHMKVEQREYRDCKLAYRQGGLKRFMPAYEGASDLTKSIMQMGAEVWICTTRPYLRLDNIDPDTREWLRRNNIEYDAVLFGEDKYEELARQVGINRVVAVADDLVEQINKAHDAGFQKIYLRDQPYNKQALYKEDFPVTHRVFNLRTLTEHIVDDIYRWRKSNGE